MYYILRLATIDDCKNLAELKQRVWAETYRGIYYDNIIDDFNYQEAEDVFINIFNNKNISLYVVESNNNLVGYMSVGKPIIEFGNYEQEIGLLYLRKSFQKIGLGKKLFNLAQKEIKEKGFNNFFVSCNKYNLNARQFYEKMGGKLICEDADIDNKRKVQAKYHYDII